ncbi:hypothetical protein Tco_1459568 [Tanacetum coccineum]
MLIKPLDALPLAHLFHPVQTLMTTSVGNNSVFRSFFEKQKLTGPNFIDWELKAMVFKQAEHELLQTVREFHTCKSGREEQDGLCLQHVPFAPNLRLLHHLRRNNPAKGVDWSTNVGSRKQKPGALSLYVGDGHRAAV